MFVELMLNEWMLSNIKAWKRSYQNTAEEHQMYMWRSVRLHRRRDICPKSWRKPEWVTLAERPNVQRASPKKYRKMNHTGNWNSKGIKIWRNGGRENWTYANKYVFLLTVYVGEAMVSWRLVTVFFLLCMCNFFFIIQRINE